MAFEAGAITADISLDREPATKAVDGTIADVKRLKEAVDGNMAEVKNAMGHAAEEGGERIRKVLEGLKEDYGKKSLIGESFELLAGGGAIAGLSIFSEQIKNVVGGVADLAGKYKEGEISGGEMVDGILKSIPVFGGLYEAASKVVDVFDGQAEAEKELALETQRESEEVAELQKRIQQLDASKQAVIELTAEFRQLGITLEQAFELDQLKGVARQIQEVQFQATNAKSEIAKAVSGKFDQQLNDLVTEQAALANSVSSLQSQYNKAEADSTAAENKWQQYRKEAIAGSDVGIENVNAAKDAFVGLTQKAGDLYDKLNAAKKQADDTAADIARVVTDRANALRGAKPDIDKIDRNAANETSRLANDAWNDLVNGAIGVADSIKQGIHDKIAEEAKDLQDRGKTIRDSVSTPEETYNTKIAEVKQLHEHGYIDDKTFARAAFADYKDLLDSTKVPQVRSDTASQFTKYVTANDVPAPVSETAKNTAKALDYLLKLQGINQQIVDQGKNDVHVQFPGG